MLTEKLIHFIKYFSISISRIFFLFLGAVSIPWQDEMIETKVFEELNIFDTDPDYPDKPPLDLDLNYVPEPEPKGCLPFLFSKLKTKSSTGNERRAAAGSGATGNTNTTNEEPEKNKQTADFMVGNTVVTTASEQPANK